MRRRGFSLLEVIVATLVVLTIIYGIVLMGQYFLVGFISGEQKYSELRESVLLNNALRIDVEGLLLDTARSDLGVQVTPATLGFNRMQNGATDAIRYEFVEATGIVRRTQSAQSPTNLGSGLVKKCRFFAGAQCPEPSGALIACPATGPAAGLKRIFIGIEVSIASDTPNQVVAFLTYKTHYFPTYANRRLASIWNRI